MARGFGGKCELRVTANWNFHASWASHLVNTCQYLPIHTSIHVNTYQYIIQYMFGTTLPKTPIWTNTCQTHIQSLNTSKYIQKYGQIRTQYIPIPPVLAGNPCAKMVLNTYQNIPNTYQFVQIHTTIHTNTGPS